jgi:hypothetical protein
MIALAGRGTPAPGCPNHRDHWVTRADSSGDSNSSSQRLASAGGSTAQRLYIICEPGLRQASEKQTIEDQRRSAATVAKTVAKPLDGARRTWTTLEYRPSLRPVTDGPGRLAHSYGSEGRGGRVEPETSLDRARDIRGIILLDEQPPSAEKPGSSGNDTRTTDALENH